jgi:mannose-6-phosphate isomerase-like protein (cupin superfamily)
MRGQNGMETLDFRPLVRQTMVITPKAMETNGEISRVELEVEAHQIGPPAHLHPGQRERYTVTHGELTVKLDGTTRVVGPGEEIEVPVGATHTFANRADDVVRFVAEHSPALRFEEYIRAVHSTLASSGRSRLDPFTLLRLVRIESSYEDTILPPPGMPRLATKVMNALGGLLGYPAG